MRQFWMLVTLLLVTSSCNGSSDPETVERLHTQVDAAAASTMPPTTAAPTTTPGVVETAPEVDLDIDVGEVLTHKEWAMYGAYSFAVEPSWGPPVFISGDRHACELDNEKGPRVTSTAPGVCVVQIEAVEIISLDPWETSEPEYRHFKINVSPPDAVLDIKVGKVLGTFDFKIHGVFPWENIAWSAPTVIAGDTVACEASDRDGPHVTGKAPGTCFVRITAEEILSFEPFQKGEPESRVLQINVSPRTTTTQPPTTTLDTEKPVGETTGPGPGDCVEAATFEVSPEPSDQSALFDYTFALKEPGDAIRLVLLPCDSLQYITSYAGGASLDLVVGAISGSRAASELELAWIDMQGRQISKAYFDSYGLIDSYGTYVGHPFVIRYKLPQPEVTLADDCDSYETRQPFTFRQETIEGWRVHFECVIEYLPGLMSIIVNDLTADLRYINSLLPTQIITRLQTTDVFLVSSQAAKPTDKMKDGCGAAVFIHPGDRRVAMPQDYLGSVVISAPCWIGTRDEQPAGMTLHEFAHAWHCMNWPCFEGDTQIEEAYEAAMASGIYDVVERKGGSMERHYGATNKQEYFATATESWFWESPNYPFNREDLLKHDPLGAAAVQAAWSVDP